MADCGRRRPNLGDGTDRPQFMHAARFERHGPWSLLEHDYDLIHSVRPALSVNRIIFLRSCSSKMLPAPVVTYGRYCTSDMRTALS